MLYFKGKKEENARQTENQGIKGMKYKERQYFASALLLYVFSSEKYNVGESGSKYSKGMRR